MATQALTIKGGKCGIIILINATFTFNEILQDLEKKFIQNTKFFKGAAIKLESNTLEIINEGQFKIIASAMANNTSIASINNYQQYLNSVPKLTNEVKEKYIVLPTQFHMGNIRSGQYLKHKGNVVVMGDLNSGAQVEADGNICVMGVIRGTVHAGINGDKETFISCKKFDAPQAQIRIADLIVRAEKESNIKNTAGLEIARIEDDNIVVLTKE
ncbi:hypothetical protein IMX26_05865 [Clostridium sp. 'deep sea']|uniref:septum site-determining protein MinC n=1 Tax=Clostridium sp. 'deep sea' TaxID=2779445 RepID=UPI0018967D23|nr:septum site-determining protein MinC [Clostridium sp. 'deep sea']QOR36338.1 hypothetical protein IMX26_05865 [Clostridium sp. 'deep sea']